jgi:hypothetical protein
MFELHRVRLYPTRTPDVIHERVAMCAEQFAKTKRKLKRARRQYNLSQIHYFCDLGLRSKFKPFKSY